MALLGWRKENGGYHKIGSIPLQASCSHEVSDLSGFVEEPVFSSHVEMDLEYVSKEKSMAYTRRIISQLEGNMKLSVCKMDGTTFDVTVPRTAMVHDLKTAVENLFDRARCGDGQISWQHVWENFCLCYDDQKLLDDSALLHQLGMREDDQLHFVRHLVTRRPGMKSHSKKRHFFYGIIKKAS